MLRHKTPPSICRRFLVNYKQINFDKVSKVKNYGQKLQKIRRMVDIVVLKRIKETDFFYFFIFFNLFALYFSPVLHIVGVLGMDV